MVRNAGGAPQAAHNGLSQYALTAPSVVPTGTVTWQPNGPERATPECPSHLMVNFKLKAAARRSKKAGFEQPKPVSPRIDRATEVRYVATGTEEVPLDSSTQKTVQ